MELENYDNSIKVFKALKNKVRKWQAQNKATKKMHGRENYLLKGTSLFYPHLMTLYSQIGYLYRQCRMHSAAMDYYKKQLVLAWQQGDTKNELSAYE